VCVFFMITGSLFYRKMIEGSFSAASFFVGRFFRIVPLYVVLVVCLTLVAFFRQGWTLKVTSDALRERVVQWLLFQGQPAINGLDAGMMNAYAVWTLILEWRFYLAVPVLSVVPHLSKRLFRHAALQSLFRLCVLVALFLAATYSQFMQAFFGGWADLFLLGMMTVEVLRFAPAARVLASGPAAAVGLAALLYELYSFPKSTGNFWAQLLLAAFFLVVAAGNTFMGVLSNRGIRYIGEISFSIYLVHGVVLYIWYHTRPFVNSFAWIVPIGLVVCCLSFVTFHLVEQPCMALGRRFASDSRPSEQHPSPSAPPGPADAEKSLLPT